MNKVCLLAVANDVMSLFIARLPVGVAVAGSQACFDKAITILRLQGDGLPDWCKEPTGGGSYVWAAAIIGGDGVLRLAPASPEQAQSKGMFERILEQHGYTN